MSLVAGAEQTNDTFSCFNRTKRQTLADEQTEKQTVIRDAPHFHGVAR